MKTLKRLCIVFLGFVCADIVFSAPGTDLLVTNIDITRMGMDCVTLEVFDEIDVNVLNDGILDCTNDFFLTVFEDTNNNDNYDPLLDTILGETIVTGGLTAGSERIVAVPVSGFLLFAYNRIFTQVDSTNMVIESFETNNLWNTGAQCVFIPPPSTFAPEIEWKWSSSPDLPTHNQIMAAPVVANLTDDNMDSKIDENDIPDVIFNCFAGSAYRDNGVLRAIQGLGGTPIFTVTDSSLRTAPGFNIGVGDIDGDRYPEILVGKSPPSSSMTPTMMLAFEHDGTYKWTSDVISFRNTAGATIADLNEDSSPEIIVGEHVLNSDGSLRWSGSMGDSGCGISCVANLDMTGLPEVIVGNTAYRWDGTIYWTLPTVPQSYSAVADFDADPFPEVALVGNGYVYLVEHDGSLIWGPVDIPPVGTTRDHGGPPTIADFDGDTFREIGVAAGYNYCVIDTDGSILWTKPTSDLSSNRTGSSVFDFDGDGVAEVVYSDEYNLFIYRGTDGKELFTASSPSGTLLELPVIVDVDNDNNAEIIMACNNYAHPGDTGIQCWGDKFDNWLNTRKIWNQHAYHITNVEDNGAIPRGERNNWETFNNYRLQAEDDVNPFLAPDLTASALVIDQTNCPRSVDIIGRIGNGGGIKVSPGVPVAVYDGDPRLSGVLLGTVFTTTDLYPGSYEDIVYTWFYTTSGYHDFFVSADDDGFLTGTVSECIENNNICGITEEICLNYIRTPTLTPTPSGTWASPTSTPTYTPFSSRLDCSSPIPVACEDDLTGDTGSAPSNVEYYNCTGWRENGPEQVYRFDLASPSAVSMFLSDLTANLDLFLLDSCSEASCIAFGNNDIYVPRLDSGVYYIVVDGYLGDAGSYTLSVRCSPPGTPIPIPLFTGNKSCQILLIMLFAFIFVSCVSCLPGRP